MPMQTMSSTTAGVLYMTAGAEELLHDIPLEDVVKARDHSLLEEGKPSPCFRAEGSTAIILPSMEPK